MNSYVKIFLYREKISAGPWRTSSMAVLECFEPSKKFTTYLHACGSALGFFFFLSPNGLCHGRQCWLLLL